MVRQAVSRAGRLWQTICKEHYGCKTGDCPKPVKGTEGATTKPGAEEAAGETAGATVVGVQVNTLGAAEAGAMNAGGDGAGRSFVEKEGTVATSAGGCQVSAQLRQRTTLTMPPATCRASRQSRPAPPRVIAKRAPSGVKAETEAAMCRVGSAATEALSGSVGWEDAKLAGGKDVVFTRLLYHLMLRRRSVCREFSIPGRKNKLLSDA